MGKNTQLDCRRFCLYFALILTLVIFVCLLRVTYKTERKELWEQYKIVSTNNAVPHQSNVTVEGENRGKVNNESSIKVKGEDYVKVKDELIILGYTEWFAPWKETMDFGACKYSNCRISSDKSELTNATILLMELKHLFTQPQLPHYTHNQYWAILSAESAGYSFNHFKREWNGLFNISITYRSTSTIPKSIYRADFTHRPKNLPPTNYYQGKTKDMLAYVSNCQSVGYNRIELMKRLSGQGLQLDIYGACGNRASSCPRSRDFKKCRSHAKYKFYLSFENSLCTEYITEKFFKILVSDHYMIPVALGGLSVEEYNSVAPPDSFIHVDNFTSVNELGQYLKLVGSNPTLFNRYHRWREEYSATKPLPMPSCELCRIANEQPNLPGISSLTQWWNNAATCRSHSSK